MKTVFTKKFWQIKRANWQIVKFKYFYSWQNTLKLIVALGVILPVCIIFVMIPSWFFNLLEEFVRENMPFKVDENPEWIKMQMNGQTRDFMMQFKTWE